MLTIESLMTSISLCIACFSLGYTFGKRDTTTKNNRPWSGKLLAVIFNNKYQANCLSVAPSLILYYHFTAFMSNIYSIFNCQYNSSPCEIFFRSAVPFVTTLPHSLYISILHHVKLIQVLWISIGQEQNVIMISQDSF